MSRTIDERVVEMQFDNKNFEKNVSKSLDTIGKLNKSLKFEDAAKGFDGITKSAKRMNLSSASGAVDTLSSRFSAMEVIAVTALANITNKAVNMGTALLKSLTIDPIVTGYSKLEEKTASVQTLLNATGMTIDEVNERLDKLMWFSDETSYSFTDMTAALSTMVSSGANIDEVIPAIMGIANATAYAGKGTAEFSRSIMNLTQSFSSGYLQLQDWKSINLAGVSTAALKQELIDTAKAMGKLNEESNVTVATFESSLSSKWADTEVMTKAFANFASETEKAYELTHGMSAEFETASEAYQYLGEQYDNLYLKAARSAQEAKTFKEAIDATKDAVSSEWMRMFEIVFGNYEEAKRLWTDLANALWDVFAAPLEGAAEVLEGWRTFDKEFGDGRLRLLEAFWTAWYNIGEILGQVKKAFRDVFPATTSLDLINLTKTLLYFARSLSITELQGTRIYKIFRGVFSVFDILKQVVAGLTYGALNVLNGLFEAFGTNIITVIVKIAELISRFRDWLRENDRLINAMGAVGKAIGNAIVKVVSFIKELWDLPQVQNVVSKVVNVCIKIFEAFGDSIKLAYESIRQFIQRFAEMDKKAALTSIIDKIRGFFTSIVDYVRSADFSIKDALGRIGKSFASFGKSLWSKFKVVGSSFEWLGDKITYVYNTIKDKLSGNTLKMIIAAGIGVALVVAINKLKNAIVAVSKPLLSFTNVMNSFSKTLSSVGKAFRATAFETYAKGILLITGAILALLGVLVLLTKFGDPDELWDAMKILGILVAGVAVFALAMAAMAKISGINSIAGAANVLALSIMLASTVKVLSKISALINDGNIVKSLGVVATIMLLMSGVVAVMNLTSKIIGPGSKMGGTSAFTILAMAIAIRTIVKALNSIEAIDTAKILTLMSSLSSIILSFSVVGFLARGRGLGSAAAILAAVVALKIIIKNLDEFTNVDQVKLRMAITNVGSIMKEFALVMMSTSLSGKYALRASLAVLVLLGAVKVVFGMIDEVSSVDASSMRQGLTVIEEIMGMLSLAMVATIASGKHSIKAAIAVLIITATMKIILKEIQNLEQMDPVTLRSTILDIAMLLGALSVALIATSIGHKSTGSMVSLMVIIGFLLTAVTILADFDKSKLLMATAVVDSIVIVLSILVASLGKLGKSRNIDKASKPLIVLTSIIAIVGGIVIALTAIDPKGSLSVTLGFSTLITAISLSIKVISKIDDMPKHVFGTLLKFSAIVGIIGLIIGLLVAWKVQTNITLVGSMAGLLLAISVAIRILKDIPEINTKQVGTLAAFTIVVGALGAIIGLLTKANFTGNVSLAISASVMLLAVSAAIRITNDIPEMNSKKVLTVVTFGGVLAALTVALGWVSSLKNQNGGNAILLALTASALLAAVVVAAEQTNKIPAINKGQVGNIATFGVLVGALAVAVSYATSIGGNNIESALITIAGTILLLAAVVIAATQTNKIPKIDLEQILNLGVMLGVITLLSSIITSMTAIEPVNALGNATALSEILLAIVAAIRILDSADGISPDTILSIGVMTVIVWGLSNIITAMAGIDYNTALASATALSMVLMSLSASVGILSLAGDVSLSAMLSIVVLGAVVTGVMALIGLLEQKDLTPSIEACASFGILITSLTAATAAIGLIGDNIDITSTAKGLASFAIVVGGITVLVELIGQVVRLFDKDMGGLEAGAEALSIIGEAIGGFIGGIVGGLLGGVAEGVLSGVGKGLADFAEESKPFFDMVKDVGPDATKGMKNIMESILMLTGAEFVDGLNFLGGDNKLSEFGTQLKEFAPDFIDYVEQMKAANISMKDVAASSAAAECVIAFAKEIPNSGGLLGKLVGENDLSDFGQQMADFAPKFKSYYDEISSMEIDQSLVDASNNAALSVIAFAKEIPNSGGLLGALVGNNDLDDFGQQLADFAPKFKSYYDEISKMKIDKGVVDRSAYAAESVIAFANAIPNEGGLLGLIAGNNNLDTFGEKLPKFAHHFVAYWNIMQGIDPDSSIIDLSSNVAMSVVAFANALPTTGGAFDWLTGTQDIGAFGEKLAKFGSGFNDYYVAISGIDFEKVDASLTGLETLINLASVVSDSQGGLSSNLLAFSEQLGRIGDESVSKFLLSFSEVDSWTVTKAIFAFLKVVGDEINVNAYKVTDAFNTDVLQVIRDGLTGLKTECVDAGLNAMTGFAGSVTANSGQVQIAFSTVLSAISGYISTFNVELYESGTSIINNFQTGICNDSNYVVMYNAGRWIVAGISDGMKSKTPDLLRDVRNMTKDIEKTVKKELDINSPSRVMAKLGQYTVQGFAKGITDSQYDLTEATVEMAKSIPESVCEELQIHSPSLTMFGIGGNIIAGIVEGIKKYAGDAIDAVGDVTDGMSDKLKEFLQGKTSLSELFGLGDLTSGLDNISSGLSGLDVNLGNLGDLGDLGNIDTSALDKLQKEIEDGLDEEPIITPVLDSDQFLKDLDSFNSYLDDDFEFDLDDSEFGSTTKQLEMLNNIDKAKDMENKVGNVYNFVQTNNSPKALNRLEIYRQTRNQLAMMKGVIDRR